MVLHLGAAFLVGRAPEDLVPDTVRLEDIHLVKLLLNTRQQGGGAQRRIVRAGGAGGRAGGAGARSPYLGRLGLGLSPEGHRPGSLRHHEAFDLRRSRVGAMRSEVPGRRRRALRSAAARESGAGSTDSVGFRDAL